MAATRTASVVMNHLRQRILFSGPITVADYMRTALTLPNMDHVPRPDSALHSKFKQDKVTQGYYMNKDTLGVHGDFITSPEITQMFGELIAVWGIDTWLKIKGPAKVNIVELGPGRGTLSKDILRVCKQLKSSIGTDITLHLVEISPFFTEKQFRNLCGPDVPYNPQMAETRHFLEGKCSETGIPIYWYKDVQYIPREFCFFVANEFFDALPIHKLQKVDKEWREVLIDFDEKEESLRFVISRNETPVIKLLRSQYKELLDDQRDHIEVNLEGFRILNDITKRLERYGGIGLLVDYGHEGTKGDTFRAFKKHKVCHPLTSPGEIDLTADVDFSHIKSLFSKRSYLCGPITQKLFLSQVGIEQRMQALMKGCKTDKEKEDLLTSHSMLIHDMGTRFFFMAILPKVLERFGSAIQLAGFSSPYSV